MMLINLCLSSYGFAMVFLNRQLNLNISPPTATMITYISQAVLVIFVGYCLDRLGRIKTIVGYMTLVLAANLIILTKIPYGFVLIFAMYGMYNLFVNMVKLRFINEIAHEDHRMDVMAVVNVLGLLVSSGLSLIYSLIAQVVKTYDFIFVTTAVFVVCLYFVAYKMRKMIDSQKTGTDRGKEGD
jgi:MFS family permease